ncbi:MAG: hypothetical protein M0Z51_16785 [Propionibacterium sp.]|nr:hypothetical protein [Propionibacterium sp.]
MAVDARAHAVPAGTDVFDPQGSDVAMSLSINDFVMAANASNRESIATLLAPTAGRPAMIFQTDTQVLWMYDGTAGRRLTSPRVYGRVTQPSATAGAGSGVNYQIPWAALDANSTHASMWTPAAPTRLIVPVDGFYQICGSAGWEANATGWRVLVVKLNGASYIVEDNRPPIGSGPTMATISTAAWLAAGSYLELQTWQNSGSTIATAVDAAPMSMTVSAA